MHLFKSLEQLKLRVLSLQVCYARVLDYRRKFIEAAQRYIDLSYRTAIHEDERMTALKHALICTVLASAGTKLSVFLCQRADYIFRVAPIP